MDTEKTLDLEGIAADAENAGKIADAYEEMGEPGGLFSYRLKKPLDWAGHRIEELHFDLDKITGSVIVKAEEAYFRDTGRTAPSTAFNDGLQAYAAALACTDRDEKGKPFISVGTIEALAAVDFRTVISRFNRFFVHIESEAMESMEPAKV